ncbi:hypothetical protein NW759_017564 [Fusarium solani]|nr:hypothetical protein NW759_017564 [Fusarium solani]
MYKNAETHLDEEVDTPFFWDSEFDGEDYELDFGAHVGGKFKADLTYSFSMISDLAFSVGGVGMVDFDKARKGNPASTQTKPINLKGHTLQQTDKTWMTFQPTRIKSDFGGFNVNFPPNPEDKLGTKNAERDDNKVSMDNHKVTYNSGDDGGRFELSTDLKFGLKLSLGLFSDLRLFEVELSM